MLIFIPTAAAAAAAAAADAIRPQMESARTPLARAGLAVAASSTGAVGFRFMKGKRVVVRSRSVLVVGQCAVFVKAYNIGW
jgi:hypothetical protein